MWFVAVFVFSGGCGVLVMGVSVDEGILCSMASISGYYSWLEGVGVGELKDLILL